MSYSKSRYNIFVPYKNGKTIIFNPLSGAIGTFDADALNRFQSDTCTEQENQLLLKKGVFILDDYDELAKINKDRAQGILDDTCKYIRIWTTSACNAQCYYCYEKGIPFVSMSKDTADALIAFIKKILKPNDTLYLEWFGGEPLLNQEIIDYIMRQIMKICHELNCKISGKMISNGSLINQLVADSLKKWEISSVQITLDGCEDTYNKIKNYLNPQENNFQKVVDGIRILNDRGIRVAVRMNYDTSNYESLIELIEFLHSEFKERKHIFYYVYPVWSALNNKSDNPFISSSEADENYLKLLKLLVKNKMCSIRDVARLNYRKNQCKSCSINGYSVFPNGDVGKCSETFIQTIGNVWDGVVNTTISNYWTSLELDEDCKACSYLPLCQGGCKSSNFTRMPKCYVNKNVLSDILKWYVESLEANYS